MIANYKDQIQDVSVYVFAVLFVVVVSIFAIYLGKIIISSTVRRFVHGKHIGRANQSMIDVKKRQDTIINIGVLLWKLVVIVSSGLAIFTIFFPDVNLVPLLASASVLGAIIGFGAQSIIRDLISGSFIIVENQFRVGDDVEIDGASGTVEHITLRSTVLRDDAAKVHYITNGSITHVVNKTLGYSRVYFTLQFTADTDIDLLTKIIEKIGTQLAAEERWKKKIVEPPTVVGIGEISGDIVTVNISGRTQTGDQYAVTNECKRRILKIIRTSSHIKLAQGVDRLIVK